MVIDPSDKRWLDFCSKSPEATLFHQPVWIKLLEDCYGYKAHVISIDDSDGNISAGIPVMEVHSWLTGKRGVCLPFSDFCQPISIDADGLPALTDELNGWRKDIGFSKINVHWDLPTQENVFQGEEVYRHVTKLDTDCEKVFRSFHKSQVQRNIKKAEKEGICVRPGKRWSDMLSFYRMHVKSRRRLGTPVQPLKFFQLLWNRIIDSGLGLLLLAHKDTDPIAGAVFFNWNNTLVYKYGASLEGYWKDRPNHAIFWNAIQKGCKEGYSVFDWGKTDTGNGGLRQFKKRWGSIEDIIQYTVVADHYSKKTKDKPFHFQLTSKLISNSPAIVGRIIGELLYRHFP